ncbi:MAG TPA: GNAT family N-acetyltransferase [Gaiellaceae bacterium]|jgi:ribosomal protein S18 acetylase RimI-like enzyme|nr:GNAT family N-acetyltransferase [Gaiellaceae bacterium]
MITLVPLTDADRDAFVREEIANYAEEQIRDAGWPRSEALARARAELLPVIERELAEARHWVWSARNAEGATVGWLWVKPGDGPRSAFLYQITVADSFRRMGYGRAMLAALEERLARDGIDELRLNVNVANVPARRLYATAGYEQLDDDGRVCRLRKRLLVEPVRNAREDDARLEEE